MTSDKLIIGRTQLVGLCFVMVVMHFSLLISPIWSTDLSNQTAQAQCSLVQQIGIAFVHSTAKVLGHMQLFLWTLPLE